MAVDSSVQLFSCSITAGVLGGRSPLSSCSIKTITITISLHISIILTMTLMSFYIYISTSTMQALGPFDTEGAKSVKVSFDPSIVTWGAPAEAALAVVGAATSKRAEIYHPHRIVYPMVMMRPFFPWLVDFCLELSLIQEVKPIKLSRLEARDVEKRTEEVMKGETGIKAGMGSAGEVPRMVEF